jgi:hypothetical protein
LHYAPEQTKEEELLELEGPPDNLRLPDQAEAVVVTSQIEQNETVRPSIFDMQRKNAN